MIHMIHDTINTIYLLTHFIKIKIHKKKTREEVGVYNKFRSYSCAYRLIRMDHIYRMCMVYDHEIKPPVDEKMALKLNRYLKIKTPGRQVVRTPCLPPDKHKIASDPSHHQHL